VNGGTDNQGTIMPPLVYVIFNRPDLTRISFDLVRKARPEVMYVAADAPRPDRPGEDRLTREARRIADEIDWDCDVRRYYAEENMGCGRRISSVITAALEDFESVIVLEDDCIPDPSFFAFCEQLLDRFRDDQRIMAISGDNFQKGRRRTDASYYFSKYPHCWGWATWRRAWQHFSLEIPQWPEFRDSGGLHAYCDSPGELEHWTWQFDQVHQGNIDTWAFPWMLCCWLQHGLTVLPSVNLVSNLGFRADGTHTLQKSPFAELPTESIDFKKHPSTVYRHAEADRFTDELVYSGPWQRQRKKKRRWFSSRSKKAKAA
jgi:hypothetical protein